MCVGAIRGGEKRGSVYVVQQQNTLTSTPSSHFIYLSASSLRIHPLPLHLIFLHGKLLDVLISTCARSVKNCLLRGPIVPVQWHYPSSAHAECLGSGKGYRLSLKEYKHVWWRDTHRLQECQTSDPFPFSLPISLSLQLSVAWLHFYVRKSEALSVLCPATTAKGQNLY